MALDISPFYTRNQGPFAQIFGLPPAESGELPPPDSTRVRLVLDVANNMLSGSDEDFTGVDRELVGNDGETLRATVALRHRFAGGLQVGMDIPYVLHSGGVFDGFIESFHDLFNLAQNGRDHIESGRLLYLYRDIEGETARVDTSTHGVGDILLSAAWQVLSRDRRKMSLCGTLKLPTGESSKLRGSGGADLSVRANAIDRQTLGAAHLTPYGSLGLLYAGDGDIIEARQNNWIGFGTIGLGWDPLAWLALKVQLDGHTAFYDSRLDQLGDFSMQLVTGGTLLLPREIHLDLGVVEDVTLERSPDVVFHLSVWKDF